MATMALEVPKRAFRRRDLASSAALLLVNLLRTGAGHQRLHCKVCALELPQAARLAPSHTAREFAAGVSNDSEIAASLGSISCSSLLRLAQSASSTLRRAR